jgi:HAD superfamily hydrolase (TIGR01509 family)
VTPSPIFIFDIGGVLVRHDNDHLFERLAARCADPASAKSYLASGAYARDIDLGRMKVEGLHAILSSRLGFDRPYDEFLKLWNCHFSAEPGMDALIASLAQKFRVVLFSNTNASHIEHVSAHYPALRRAHKAYYSYELGLAKPDAEAFRKVLELERRQPEEAVFIDDKAENAAAAASLGMRAIAFTGCGALARALKDLTEDPNA